MIMFAVPAAFVCVAIFGGLYITIETYKIFLDNEILNVLSALLMILVFIGYVVFQTSIRVEVYDDLVTVKRLFKKRFEGFLNETSIRAHVERSQNLLRPSTISIFIKDVSDDSEIRVLASGLGESRTKRLLELPFESTQAGQHCVLATRKQKKVVN